MARRISGPGVSKVRFAQAVARRERKLAKVRGGWWARMLDGADVVSEGSTAHEGAGATYYGTTSLRCPLDVAPGSNDDAGHDGDQLVALVLADPHARLRLLRLAHREAAARAQGPLGVLHAEMSGRLMQHRGARVVAIDIDVSADVVEVGRDAM